MEYKNTGCARGRTTLLQPVRRRRWENRTATRIGAVPIRRGRGSLCSWIPPGHRTTDREQVHWVAGDARTRRRTRTEGIDGMMRCALATVDNVTLHKTHARARAHHTRTPHAHPCTRARAHTYDGPTSRPACMCAPCTYVHTSRGGHIHAHACAHASRGAAHGRRIYARLTIDMHELDKCAHVRSVSFRL